MKIKFKVKKFEYEVSGNKYNYTLIETKGKSHPRYYQHLDGLLQDVFHMTLRRAENVDSFRALAKEAQELNDIIRSVAKEIRYSENNVI